MAAPDPPDPAEAGLPPGQGRPAAAGPRRRADQELRVRVTAQRAGPRGLPVGPAGDRRGPRRRHRVRSAIRRRTLGHGRRGPVHGRARRRVCVAGRGRPPAGACPHRFQEARSDRRRAGEASALALAQAALRRHGHRFLRRLGTGGRRRAAGGNRGPAAPGAGRRPSPRRASAVAPG